MRQSAEPAFILELLKCRLSGLSLWALGGRQVASDLATSEITALALIKEHIATVH